MTRIIRFFGIAAIAVSISACGGKTPEEKQAEKYDGEGGLNLSRLVGTTKNPPDEFAVIASAPLQMPKDFAALPAPSPGSRSPLAPDPIAEAREALLGDSTPQAANVRTSVSESALLSAAGPSDSNIRSVLEADQEAIEAQQTTYVLDEVFPSLRNYRGEDLKDTIKPNDERLRLSEANSAAGASRSGIATIPGGTAATTAPLPIIPPTGTPVTAIPVSASPGVPETGGELIYIPE